MAFCEVLVLGSWKKDSNIPSLRRFSVLHIPNNALTLRHGRLGDKMGIWPTKKRKLSSKVLINNVQEEHQWQMANPHSLKASFWMAKRVCIRHTVRLRLNRLPWNVNAFTFAFDEQVKQFRTLFQALVYICMLTVNKTILYEKRHIMN